MTEYLHTPDVGVEPEDAAIKQIAARFWKGRWLVLGACLISVVLSVLVMHFSTPIYTASMVVAPTAKSGGGLSALAQNPALQDLAGSVGLGSLGGGQSQNFDRFLQVATSQAFAQRIASDKTIMHHIFYKKWDEKNGVWRKGLLYPLKAVYLWFFGLPPWHPPDASDLAKKLTESINIASVPRTQFQRIEYKDRDPVFARQMLWRVYRDVESMLKKDAAAIARSQINYIEQRLTGITNAQNRYSLIQLEVEAERTLVLTQSDSPFSAEMVDPPSTPTMPSFPRPALLTLIAAAFGLIVGGVLSLLLDVEALVEKFRFPRARRSQSPSYDGPD